MVVKGREPVESWYSEGIKHVFGKEPSTLKTGHFTQIVWRDSRELGVGMARNRSGQIFVVANYDPPGNFIGSFAENVSPLGGFDAKAIHGVPHVTFEPIGEFDLEGFVVEHFTDAILKSHNDYRRKHASPPLK